MIKIFFPILLICLMTSPKTLAGEVRIAVAANFAEPLKNITKTFNVETGHSLIISSGATGRLYAQIREGAPFDVFLSADQEHPIKLIEDKLALEETRFTYAVGILVLWSPEEKFVDPQGSLLKKLSFKHIALANPKLAPYGSAAKEVLEKRHLWQTLKKKIVYGENISQAYHFVFSRNAEVGFVALSQVLARGGSYWQVPWTEYQPLNQDAVLLTRGKNNIAAKEFLEFIKRKSVNSIISEFGYRK